MIRHMRRLVVIEACLAAVVACLITPAGASIGTRTYVAQYGISFVLPHSWTQVSLSSGDIGGLLGTASKLDAGPKSLLTTQAKSAVAKGLKFFAVSHGAQATVNIEKSQESLSLDEIDVAAKMEMTSIGAKDIATKTVRYPYGRAVELSYSLLLGNSSTRIYGTQVYVKHAGDTYITTFSSALRSIEARAASQMMPTWQFSS